MMQHIAGSNKEVNIINQDRFTETKQEHQSSNNNVDLHFPWMSSILSLLVIGFLVIGSQQDLVQFYSIPEFLLTTHAMIGIALFTGIIYFIDIRLFLRKKTNYQKRIENLQQQLEAVWKSKKQQQQRANIFSGHADKLKYFISEKLLESIEYDEKFLHFKGIAAEVRHNGVISYDKTLTALNKAIDQHYQLEKLHNEVEPDKYPSKQSLNTLASYETAIDSIRYLWDLLDLSTAENMSLHIGDHLIECEEHYYQLNLDAEKQFEVTQSIPLKPTFNPQLAALMTIAILTDESEIKTTISLAKIDDSILQQPFLLKNSQFNIRLLPTPALLGNPNHIILLLENLIKNAQFFILKNRFKQKNDRIHIGLFPGDGFVELEIYNHGPTINNKDMEQIFTLGYSTRKSKNHHGKGLGLYFASEIVKGYNGNIQVKNIANVETKYTLTIELLSGEINTLQIISQWIDGRMKVVLEDNTNWQNELKITLQKPIQSIELTSEFDSIIHLSENISKQSSFEWLEPSINHQSKWQIQIIPTKKRYNLLFKPRDISGVSFNIKLPTADSRLNEQQLDFENEN